MNSTIISTIKINLHVCTILTQSQTSFNEQDSSTKKNINTHTTHPLSTITLTKINPISWFTILISIKPLISSSNLTTWSQIFFPRYLVFTNFLQAQNSKIYTSSTNFQIKNINSQIKASIQSFHSHITKLIQKSCKEAI